MFPLRQGIEAVAYLPFTLISSSQKELEGAESFRDCSDG